MALTKNYSIDRVDVGTATATPLSRGFMLNGQQVEQIRIAKLTGDTTGQVALSGIQRPYQIYMLPLIDSAGVTITAKPTLIPVLFTHVNNSLVNLTGLGTWTSAILYVLGRSYKYV